MGNVYLNGRFLPLEDAKVSVLDRGFTFGDGVYEVFLVYKRKIFRLEEHLARLERSFAGIYMKNPMTRDEWTQILTDLVKDNPADNQSLYLQITRGVSERDHAIASARGPTIFAMSKPLPERNLVQGINAITCEDIRWKFCDIKAITLLPSVLLRHQAMQEGATEAILYKGDTVTEGAASNVFIVRDGKVKTPPKSSNILPGITRDLVVELLQNAGIPCEETNITRNELMQADEIWITSSTWEIVPVIKLDGSLVGDGQPGKLWHKAMNIYQNFKAGQNQSN